MTTVGNARGVDDPSGVAIEGLALRPVNDSDVDVVTGLIAAQDVAWWGEPDADADDTRLEFDRVRLA